MITAIILCKNEEENIVDCLDSVSFCDEVIVIDDESIDRTVEIAKKQGAKIEKHKLQDDFAAQRNYALTLTKSEWVLFVDADERISKSLAEEIDKAVKENAKDGFFIPREDVLFGKKLRHGELAGKKFLRLGKREKGTWNGRVHEEWFINGTYGTLKNPLVHYPHQSLSEFISEVNYYTSIRAEELHRQHVSSSFLSILLYTKGKFFYTYILRLGFLDGVAGLVMSLMMSFHSFLTRGKLYLLIHKKP